MIITVDIPVNKPGMHFIKFIGGPNDRFNIRRCTFGEFKMTVYYGENRYVTIDFLNYFVTFDCSVGANYQVDHYSHFRRDNRFVFECSEIDLFNPVKYGKETGSSES